MDNPETQAATLGTRNRTKISKTKTQQEKTLSDKEDNSQNNRS